MHVAIRELKASLSRVLARARAGEVIEITSHSRPIARIVGIPDDAADGLRRLVASGAATWAGGKPMFDAPLALRPAGTPVSQMVSEDRG
jgi:prevent-host-death family protein